MRYILIITVLLIASEQSLAQTTKPAGWPTAVQALTRVMLDGDPLLLSRLLARGCDLRQLDGRQAQSLDLLNRTARSSTVSLRAYGGKPATAAADLSADFQKATFIPRELAKRMGAEDEAKANATAARWVLSTLGASDDDAVGVIVLWTHSAARPAAMTPLFVLVKGEQVAPDQFRIRQIAFGEVE